MSGGTPKAVSPEVSAINLWKSLLPPPQIYPAQTELLKQGQPPSEAYFIESGLVKLARLDAKGRDLLVGLRSPSWFVGIAPIIAGTCYPVTALTMTRCSLLRVPADLFLELVKNEVELSIDVQRRLSKELLDQIERLTQLSYRSSRHRIERTLLEWVGAVDPNAVEEVRLSFPLKHRELASLLAVTPQHLSRVFTHLRQDEAVQWKHGMLVVNPVQLRRLMGQERNKSEMSGDGLGPGNSLPSKLVVRPT